MKKLILAACVAAVGVPAFGQRSPAPSAQSNVDYGYYGGPAAPKTLASPSRTSRERLGGLYGPYKLWGVPDELTIAEQQRDRNRDAAVEFGRCRRQFTGSTQFWMDHHRTELAVSRYAMDEPLWRALHPPEYFGNGGYLYNTAESVGSEVIWGPPHRIMVENPRPVVNTTPYEVQPVPASRRQPVVAPRVVAGGKPIYDAAATVSGYTSN
jgi:hypothetical protein